MTAERHRPGYGQFGQFFEVLRPNVRARDIESQSLTASPSDCAVCPSKWKDGLRRRRAARTSRKGAFLPATAQPSQSVDRQTGLSYSAVNTLETAMPSISLFCPAVDEPTQTAEATSKILAVPRPTIVGWINRYPWLGIPQVTPGTTRRFSMIDLGMLAVIRLVLSARIPAETIAEVEGLNDHILSLYAELQAKATMEDGYPYMPWPEKPAHLRAQEFMGGSVTVLALSREVVGTTRPVLMDLAGYPVPFITLHTDAAIRNAWQRMLHLRAGLELDD